MLDWINNAILTLADPVLNGLLRLPVDWALLIVGVGTGSVITCSRLFTTDQDLLRRCDRDTKRIKELMREAKGRKDKPAVRRYRTTLGMIGMTKMRQEGWPLLTTLLPIAILGTWCFQRLAFVPPQTGETLSISACFPVSAVGEIAHIVPQPGVREVSPEVTGGRARWIQPIVEDRDPRTGAPVGAVATWKVQADASPDPYKIEIRYKTYSVQKELLVGQRVYLPDVTLYPAGQPVLSVRTEMRPVKFLGVVPGIPSLLMPPWLVAYFLIAIPSVSLVKKVARIA